MPQRVIEEGEATRFEIRRTDVERFLGLFCSVFIVAGFSLALGLLAFAAQAPFVLTTEELWQVLPVAAAGAVGTTAFLALYVSLPTWAMAYQLRQWHIVVTPDAVRIDRSIAGYRRHNVLHRRRSEVVARRTGNELQLRGQDDEHDEPLPLEPADVDLIVAAINGEPRAESMSATRPEWAPNPPLGGLQRDEALDGVQWTWRSTRHTLGAWIVVVWMSVLLLSMTAISIFIPFMMLYGALMNLFFGAFFVSGAYQLRTFRVLLSERRLVVEDRIDDRWAVRTREFSLSDLQIEAVPGGVRIVPKDGKTFVLWMSNMPEADIASFTDTLQAAVTEQRTLPREELPDDVKALRSRADRALPIE